VGKIGILTFHYSNNYGGVLQALALQRTLESMGYNTEIINYVPSSYKPTNILNNLGISKNIFKNRLENLNVFKILNKINIISTYSDIIVNKFEIFRANEMKLSKQVDENKLTGVLDNYDLIIVGSDQIWNPSQRKRPEYFLNFVGKFHGKKISYAADSTVSEVSNDDIENLKEALNDFSYISVRNKHSLYFVKTIINKEVDIVADPTILYDFSDDDINMKKKEKETDYILMYVLGKEIDGTHIEAINQIKKVYGDLAIYSIKIPTMNFELSNFADKVLYDLDPYEWIGMLKNAKFIYTDSFHGVLFSLKYHKPFLAYYTEKMRATRFLDLGERYNIERYIIQNVDEITTKRSIEIKPNFSYIDDLLVKSKHDSINFLDMAMKTCIFEQKKGE
jgi:polysaccharide pyruvyl transferase WcaK-like protein